MEEKNVDETNVDQTEAVGNEAKEAGVDINSNGNEEDHNAVRRIVSANQPVESEIKLYKIRFLVLFAFCLSSFTWNLTTYRQVMIASSYAKYYNVSNEMIGQDGNLGIDAITAIPSITVLIGYLISAMLIDTLGVRMMNIGTCGVMIGCWVWYGAFSSFDIAFASSIIISLTGPFILTSLLAVSNRFFPDHERAKATATGTFCGLVGSGAAFAITPMYETSGRIVNIHLKSCQTQNLKAETLQLASVNNQLSCDGNKYEDAYNAFCCYTEADIDALNLHFAILATAVFVFGVFAVRDKPPTPPSHAAKALQDKYQPMIGDDAKQVKKEPDENGETNNIQNKEKSSCFQGYDSMKSVLKSRPYVQLTIADFFLSGGPETVVATVSRLLPASVAEYDTYMIAGGILISIPTVLITSKYLDQLKTYFTFTSGAYAAATVLWLIASICLTIANNAASIIFIITGAMSVIVYIVWQVTGYELKLEYCYRPDLPVEASVVGIDRIVVNISSVLFLLAIPPERVGPANTMWISFGFILLGDVIVYFIKDKYNYRRKAYEDKERENRNNSRSNNNNNPQQQDQNKSNRQQNAQRSSVTGSLHDPESGNSDNNNNESLKVVELTTS